MNKSHLTQLLAQEANLTLREAGTTIDKLLGLISSSANRGIPVTIRGFGTFSVRERRARAVRNHRTGETQRIPATMALRFKPARSTRKPIARA